MEDYPELRSAVQDVELISVAGFRQAMIQLNLRGPDLAQLQENSDKIMTWMRQRPEYVDIDTSLSLRKPELRVKIDREKASDLDIPVQTIAATLNVLVGGEPVTKYKEFDEQYDVWLRAELPFRDRPEVIGQLMLDSPKAGLVQLTSLATLNPAKGPATIDRFGMQRQVVVTANLEGNKALGDAVGELSALVDSLKLPADYRYEFIGKAKMMGESNQNFLIAFLASFLFMYMILGAQFESFVHPITILLALPLTLPFALISLILLRTNLNIYAMFGLFMLFGIVKKNGILQVDYTNVLRGQGLPRDEAILEANHTRLRPILMTTVMLIAAMIPIALGQGPGAASRASLAKVILGGQTLSLAADPAGHAGRLFVLGRRRPPLVAFHRLGDPQATHRPRRRTSPGSSPGQRHGSSAAAVEPQQRSTNYGRGGDFFPTRTVWSRGFMVMRMARTLPIIRIMRSARKIAALRTGREVCRNCLFLDAPGLRLPEDSASGMVMTAARPGDICCWRASAMAACLLAGCTSVDHWWHNRFKVGPNYCRPATPVADQWIDADNPNVKSADRLQPLVDRVQRPGARQPGADRLPTEPAAENRRLADSGGPRPARDRRRQLAPAEAGSNQGLYAKQVQRQHVSLRHV